ncbi:MAG: hypothetical protein Fur0037_13950 [Planctomycetota bacterium]
MSQVDLPPISLQRYFDLLKRRRWQVVPVSLLGLLIGGIVALLIPRYFVAETQLTYRGSPADVALAKARDPVSLMVEAARLTIPDAVSEALAKLAWPETVGLDADAREDLVRELRGRLDIVDVSPGRDSEFAKLHLVFRDRDGARAKAFLDTLVGTWVERELRVMRDRANARLASARDVHARAVQAYEACSRELAALEQRYGLWPGNSAIAEQEANRAAEQRRQELADAAAKAEREQRDLRLELERIGRQIDATPPTLTGPAELDPRVLEDKDARELAQKVVVLRKILDTLGPAHMNRKTREAELAEAQDLLNKALERLGIGNGENPALLALKAKQASLQADLDRAIEADRDAAQKLAELDRRQKEAASAWEQHRALEANLAALARERDAAQEAVAEAARLLGQLDNDEPISHSQAWVPAVPTDPNVLLVALVGCALGLCAAIGLILALDLLKGTFKTLEEVERSLSVPVLGGISHIETEEQRNAVAGSRRRASLMAGSFVVLMVVLVTWYYREPTSLPPFVRDLLSMLLGEG